MPEVESETLTSSQEQSAGIATLIALSVWVNYMVFAEWRFGRTIGKAALGIRVVRLDGSHLTWNAALARNLLRLPDLIAIFFTAPTSEHRQRLGDRAAKTVVLRLRDDERLAAPAGAAPNESADWGGARVLAGLVLLLLISFLAALIASAFDPDLETLGAVLVLQGLLAAAMVYVAVPGREGRGVRAARRARPRSVASRAGFDRGDRLHHATWRARS